MTLKYNRHLSFPFRIGVNGRTVQVSTVNEHVKDEITQLILTNPGERLFLPEFGGGLRLFLFSNLDEPTIAMAKTAITQNLLTWLGDRISLEGLELDIVNEKLILKLKYRVKASNEFQILSFQKRGG